MVAEAIRLSQQQQPPPPPQIQPVSATAAVSPPVRSEEDMLAEAIRQSLELSPAERARAPAGGGVGEKAAASSPPALGGGGGAAVGGVAALVEQHARTLRAHPTTVDTLIAVLQMILEHPGEAQYRRLRLSNRKFRATVCDVLSRCCAV